MEKGKRVQIREFNYKKFFKDNEEIIRLYNNVIYPKIACIGAIVTTIALVGSLFNEYMGRARIPYAIIWGACLFIYITRKSLFWKKRPTQCMYLVFSLIFLALLYMSIVIFNQGTGSSILVLLTIFPVAFTDRPEKLFSADVGMFLIHSVASFMAKDIVYAGLDLVNGLIATIIGCVFGFFILNSRLHALNYRSLLAIERETDVLTTLFNRRKLTEMIEGISRGFFEKPAGVVMLDIDWFKDYNDTYGHIAGDHVLSSFGTMLREGPWETEVTFYRYGGEEFVGFVWKADRELLPKLAEEIREKTQKLKMEHRPITVSIGYVYCDDPKKDNYESWIKRADKALYIAKGRGRNCVISYDEIKE